MLEILIMEFEIDYLDEFHLMLWYGTPNIINEIDNWGMQNLDEVRIERVVRASLNTTGSLVLVYSFIEGWFTLERWLIIGE